jgi:hypothetical protein
MSLKNNEKLKDRPTCKRCGGHQSKYGTNYGCSACRALTRKSTYELNEVDSIHGLGAWRRISCDGCNHEFAWAYKGRVPKWCDSCSFAKTENIRKNTPYSLGKRRVNCRDCNAKLVKDDGSCKQVCESCVAANDRKRHALRSKTISGSDKLKSRRREIHKNHRVRLRNAAISAMGGKCEHCGFDNPVALQFDHIEPLLRRTSGVGKAHNADRLYRAICDGHTDGLQLLCANCHIIKTRTADLDVMSISMRGDILCEAA